MTKPIPLALDDIALYVQQRAMAANVSCLKSKNAKRQQVTLLVRALVKRMGVR